MKKRNETGEHGKIQDVIETLGELFSTDPAGKEAGRAVIFTLLVYYAQLMERQGRGDQHDIIDAVEPFVAAIGWNYPGKTSGGKSARAKTKPTLPQFLKRLEKDLKKGGK